MNVPVFRSIATQTPLTEVTIHTGDRMHASLKHLILKASQTPPDDPQTRLQRARQAVEEAQRTLTYTTEHTPQQAAQRAVERRHAERAEVEREVTREELSWLEAELHTALAQKTVLHEGIKAKLLALIPDLAALDALEQKGLALNGAVCSGQRDTAAPMGALWHDPKQPGCADLLRRWVARLEAS